MPARHQLFARKVDFLGRQSFATTFGNAHAALTATATATARRRKEHFFVSQRRKQRASRRCFHRVFFVYRYLDIPRRNEILFRYQQNNDEQNCNDEKQRCSGYYS